ncbi:MAG: hypothetical protein OXU31_07240 [Gammaproteobacteria bacterium]|nr:hypothetical protein [Gammaproteobacteria bacterium]MDD9815747.1 hypothetical protein [Gammaproteobacteria bacterium]
MPRARFTCRRGKTHLGPTENKNNSDIKQKHLFIILTNPSEDGGVVTATISTVRDSVHDDDLFCMLNKGGHPFIRHQSYVDCKRARIEKVSLLEYEYAQRIIRPPADMGDDVLRRICRGLLKSKKTRIKIQEFYEENLHRP